MSEFQAVIFDLDGVIADTADMHFRAWERLGIEVGIPFTREDYSQIVGFTREASLVYFLKGRRVNELTAKEYMRRKGDYFLEQVAHLTSADAMEGVLDRLLEAKQLGLRIGLASASKTADKVLEQLELTLLFDVIAFGNMVAHSKPAPDIYNLVAEKLDVIPSKTIVFEDSPTGVEAARAAGMIVVVVGEPNPHAHLYLPNLVDTSLPDIIQNLR